MKPPRIGAKVAQGWRKLKLGEVIRKTDKYWFQATWLRGWLFPIRSVGKNVGWDSKWAIALGKPLTVYIRKGVRRSRTANKK